MTKVDFTFPVKGITGQVDAHHKLSFRTAYGKTHAYHYTNRSNYKPNSEAQVAHRQAFIESYQKAKAELQIPERYDYWLNLFKKQKKYVRLDRFVAAQLLKASK